MKVAIYLLKVSESLSQSYLLWVRHIPKRHLVLVDSASKNPFAGTSLFLDSV